MYSLWGQDADVITHGGGHCVFQVKMEKISPMVGGGDVELVERAKHRGRAYQCLPCYHKEGRVVINEKGRIEDHILKNHVKLDEVPYYCSLCLFRCHSLQQLNKHVTAYARHREMARKRDVQDHQPYLMKSSNPYKIGSLDYMQLSTEESIRHFMQQARLAKERDVRNPVTQAVQQMLPSDFQVDITSLLNLVEASPIAKSDAGSAGHHVPDTLPTSIGTPADVGLYQMPDEQARLNTPVMDQQVLRQAAVPRTATDTTMVQQVTAQTPVAQMMPHTPMLLNQILDLSRSSAPQTASVISLASHHQGPSQMSAVPENQTTADLPSEPLDLSLKTVPHPQMENQKPATQPPRMPRKTSACRYGSDHGQQRGAASRFPLGIAAQTPLSVSTESPDCEDVAESEDPVMNSPAPADMSLGKQTVERLQTSSEGQGSYLQEAADRAEQEEDLMDQLLPQEDMELSISTTKRAAPSESEEPLPKKKRSTEEPTFDISLIAVNGLVAALHGLREDMVKNTRTMDRMEKTLVETNVLLSKAMDSMTRLKNVLEGNEKEEKRREERRQEADRRREEERRREREEDRRREERRREAERRDREERRRNESGCGSGHKDERRNEEKKEDTDKRRKQDKENEPRVKSVLGRTYTENEINDYGRRH